MIYIQHSQMFIHILIDHFEILQKKITYMTEAEFKLNTI